MNMLQQMKAPRGSISFTNDFVLQLITGPKFRIYRHLILIVFLVGNFLNSKDISGTPANVIFKVAAFGILMMLFYFNMYWLIPKFIFKGHYFFYFAWVMILLVATILLFTLMRSYLKPYFNVRIHEKISLLSVALRLSFMFFIFMAASAALKLFQYAVLVNQRVNELQTATIHSELEQLKNQINPHFLFNMLNNANVLTQTDPQKASQVLMKLSDLLRYQLYDSARSKVLLTSDIHFLEDFLILEKVRRDNFEFHIVTEGEASGVQISPLLFITFVENAVKHSVDTENPSYIHILFKIEGGELFFNCTNSKSRMRAIKRREGGLGLANVTRRLKLLYPDKHFLYIKNGDELFSVDLKLEI